jgi:hypothetical protein
VTVSNAFTRFAVQRRLRCATLRNPYKILGFL